MSGIKDPPESHPPPDAPRDAGLFSIFGCQDTVPRSFERDLEEHPHLFFVINQQDGRHCDRNPSVRSVARQRISSRSVLV